MKPMETLQDLIEEAKTRTICWAICIFAISYFLSHTSKSMWVNIPISVMILVAFRYLSYEVELRWKLRPAPRPTYLLHLEKKQLSLDDPRLSAAVSSSRWKRKIDSPPVEAAIEGFIDKILQDFVVDLWYSSITPDKETPELIRSLILDVLGEVSGRVRGINLVDLLTRNLVDLIGNQLDLYRKNQSEIGVEVMGTLSFEERDERLKHHLIASKELHPALFSSESEQKVLQRIIGGVLALVLKPRDAQCPLVRCISRELLTCLVMRPVMNFASPWYINELIEYMFLNKGVEVDADKSINSTNLSHGHNNVDSNIQNGHIEHQTSASNINQLALVKSGNEKSVDDPEPDRKKKIQKDYVPKQAEWAMVLDATTKRRSEVLAPENLENMWTKGRNYQKKTAKLMKAGGLSSSVNSMPSSGNNVVHTGNTGKELLTDMGETIKGIDEKYMVHLMQGSGNNEQKNSLDMMKKHNKEMPRHDEQGEDNARAPSRNVKVQIKRSSSTSDLNTAFIKRSDTSNLREDYDPNHTRSENGQTAELVSHSEETLHAQKIKCRVIGAYFEKLGSKSFAVYSIAVTDVENTTWFVKRRYRNFERLHRYLKDIPNYSLHLPPKRFLSSSIDDYFVHQRCILLDKYLQELLSIANIAEQHEVWDFLSESSKNYSFGKSTSVMQTLAVNVDDAMDDIVRQFKGVSDGLRRKVAGPSTSNTSTSPVVEKRLAISWNEELHKQISGSHEMESSHSLSDEEIHDDDSSPAINSGWHSDNELNSKSFPPRILNHNEKTLSLESQRSTHSERNARMNLDASKSSVVTDFQDPVGMPPEWTPPNVSVPLLNLVDKVFQLNRRGWLRRQVYWMSKQVLQLMMEDAIDDWILRQIHLLRKDDVIAQGIVWIQDVLWPNGKFFKELESSQRKKDDDVPSQRPSQSTSRVNGDNAHGTSSFELQLEAARRASDVKKMILGGAPTALVSLIGPSQYKRSAKDIYYFLQSTICIKQLAYSMLELVLVTIFPELRDLMIDIHEKACYQTL